MSKSRERELVESTSSTKTGHQVETLAQNFSCLKETAGTKMEKILRVKRPSDRPKLESISRGGSKT
jgi:hypothetical protein